MPRMIHTHNLEVDYESGTLTGFGVGGAKDDGSVLLLVALRSGGQVGVKFTSSEEVDEAIASLQAARIEAFGNP